MDCRQCREVAGRHLDGESDMTEAARLERHLSGCPDCARLYRDLGALASVHARLSELEPPEGMTERIVAACRVAGACAASERPGAGWKAVVAAAAAAVVLLGIYAGSFIERWYLEPAAPQYAEVTGLEYLGDYPPASFGEALEVAAGGGYDE